MSAMSTGKLRESIVRESVHIHLESTSLLSRPKEQKVEIDYTVYIESCTAASFSNGDRNNSGTLDSHKLLCAGLDKILKELGNDGHYKEWFGAYTSSRFSKVKNTYTLTRKGIAGKSLTYYNNGPQCQSNRYIAYTYKSYDQRVTYLCNLFYGFPTACRGTDYTKEGTLVHEWVHAFAARDDVVYGASNCRNLANTKPDDAIRNAASHEYYYCTGR